MFAQQLGNSEYQVGCSRTLSKLARQLHTYNQRNQHGNRLAQHGGFSFDSAHTPAQNAETVDHGRVRIGTDQRVGICHALPVGFLNENHACQVLEIYLVHDTRVRWNDGKIAKCRLPPPQKCVTFLVAHELQLRIDGESPGRPEFIYLYRVVDYQFSRL